MIGVLVKFGDWGRNYRGDFIAGFIALLEPFFITWAFKGFSDIVTVTNLAGLISLGIFLSLSKKEINQFFLDEWRKRKFHYPIKVGILNGCLFENKETKRPKRPFTDFLPEDWYNVFSRDNDFRVSWVLAKDISDQFGVIINPFGEEYPEIDKPNQRTLKQITEYIRNGGVFVNVAGLAFFIHGTVKVKT